MSGFSCERAASFVLEPCALSSACLVTFTFTFSHLADAFIQSDLELGVHKVINLDEANIQRKCQ